jgi:hypothetical protein
MPAQQAIMTHARSRATELHVDRVSSVRVALDPYTSVLALVTDALGRQRGAPQAWRRRIRAALSPRSAAAVLHVIAPQYSVLPDCTTPLNPVREMSVGDQVDWLHALPDTDLLGDLHTVFGGQPPPHWRNALRRPRAWLDDYARVMSEAWSAIEPLWAGAQPLLDREVERVGAAVVRGGLGLVLDRLHPASRFADGVLTIRDPEPARFTQGGRPLVLVPMVSGQQSLICNLERSDAVWIGYPLPGLHERSRPRDAPPPPGDLLTSVLGPVRAQVLRAAHRPVTMSDLAQATCLVPSAVTYQCGRLAAAGLIRREQQGRQVWITRTSRGAELIALFARQS